MSGVNAIVNEYSHSARSSFSRAVLQSRGDGVYCIDSTDVRTMLADQGGSKCYDPTAKEYYYGYDCTIVSTGSKIPIAAEFTESKQAPEETASASPVTARRRSTDLGGW